MSGDIPLVDMVNAELDARKIQKLVDDGVISREELQNAPIIHVASPPPLGPTQHGPGKIIKVTCQWQGMCGREFPDLSAFEEHIALDHMGLTKTGDE